MTPTLRDQFERLALRLAELDATLMDPQVSADMQRYRTLAREQAEAHDLVERYRRYGQREADKAAAEQLLTDAADAADMAEMAREEIAAASADMARLHLELQSALIPRDPDDARNAFVEIRAGTDRKSVV